MIAQVFSDFNNFEFLPGPNIPGRQAKAAPYPSATGQYSNTDDFGLIFYNARWFDPQLGRFAQADTIIPLQAKGTQAWVRYAYVNNNPLRYTDPSGHKVDEKHCSDDECIKKSNPKLDLRPVEKDDSDTLCPAGSSYCHEFELSEEALGKIEAMLDDLQFGYELSLFGFGAIAGVAELVALGTGELSPIAISAHVVAVIFGLPAAASAIEASQLSVLADYVGDMKEYAHDNGTTKLAFFKKPSDLTPSLTHEGDTDGQNYGFATITGYFVVKDMLEIP